MRLRICPIEPADGMAVAALLTHMHVAPWLDILPWDRPENVAARWTKIENYELSHRFAAWDGEELIGVAGLDVAPRARQRHTAAVWLAVHPERRGVGVGKALLATLVELAENWLNVTRVVARAHHDNEAARALLASHGFDLEIRKRGEIMRDGVLTDTVLMARIIRRAALETRGPSVVVRGEPLTVSLRYARPADSAALARLHREPAAMWGTLQLPSTPIALWQDRFLSNRPEQHALFVAEADGEVVGLGGIHGDTSLARAHTRELGITVATQHQGRGVGLQIMRRLIEHAERVFAARRIELQVYADNGRARAMYQKLGFVEEGILRQDGFGNGVYLDGVVMARLSAS